MICRSGLRSKHTLPELPYDVKALEPIISCDIMAVHHQKHHATYVANLNAAEDKLKQAVEKGIRFYTQLACYRKDAMNESYLRLCNIDNYFMTK